jgi:hypothetical protein
MARVFEEQPDEHGKASYTPTADAQPPGRCVELAYAPREVYNFTRDLPVV